MQNLSRVAASAAEIKAVLVKDAGLMVELKHWVAKDATDHGQIVGDSDLTNELYSSGWRRIFNFGPLQLRWSSDMDISFRS